MNFRATYVDEDEGKGDGTDGGNGTESDKDDCGSSDNEDIPEFVGQAAQRT